ncbi:MAG TPA: tetratricopeptide repeat protein [Coriobacteriia bacterium]
MAIDKARTSPAMKAGVIILIIAFVAGFGVIGIGALSGGGTPSQQQTGTQASAGALQQVSQTNLSQIGPNEQALKAKPKDYELLKTLGNQYSDYAQQVAQAAPGAGLELTIYRQAIDYYKQALAVKPGDPNVETDMAIAQFYSGDTASAIATAEQVRKAQPRFAPAVFNLGVFYKAFGQNAKAVASLEEYLKLEPNGPSAANANKLLTELRSGVSQPPVGSTSATGN